MRGTDGFIRQKNESINEMARLKCENYGVKQKYILGLHDLST